MEIKNIKRKLYIHNFIVTFSYETFKGYYREQQRNIKGFNYDNAKEGFYEWAREQRTMSNVKILGIERTFTQAEEIER